MVLSVSVIFYAISTLSNAVLQSIGRLNSPVVNAAIALVLQTAGLVAMIIFLDENYGPYYYAVTIILYAFLMCVLNGAALKKHLNYKQEIGRTFVRPILASAVMGVVAFLVYQGMYLLVHSNLVSLFVAVVLAAAVYFVMILLFGAVTEDEMKMLPKGYLLVKIARKTRLLRT